MATKAELFDMINVFLADHKSTKRGGWAPVTKSEVTALYEIFNDLIELKYDKDCDGDLPLEFAVTDRNLYEGNHYACVPYSHAGETEAEEKASCAKAFEMALYNLEIATSKVNQLSRTMQHYAKDAKNAKKDGG